MLNFRGLGRRLKKPTGQTMTEYALILAGVALIALAGYNGLGNTANSAINAVNQLMGGGGHHRDGGFG